MRKDLEGIDESNIVHGKRKRNIERWEGLKVRIPSVRGAAVSLRLKPKGSHLTQEQRQGSISK